MGSLLEMPRDTGFHPLPKTEWGDEVTRKETMAEGVELYLGDCREILPTLGPIEAVVTDPPYGISHNMAAGGGNSWRKSRRVNGGSIVGDDQPFDPIPWLEFPEVIMFGADHFYPRLPDCGRWLVWDKKAGWSFEDNFSDVEFAWHSKEGPAKIINYLWKGVRQDGEKGLPKYHMAQKPIAVMEWLINQLHSDGHILDPFMGSGTTGVAAIRLGRRFVGIEIESKYFDISRQRISKALNQLDMFIEPPKPAKQEAFEL